MTSETPDIEEMLSDEGLLVLAHHIVRLIAAQVPIQNVRGPEDVTQRLKELRTAMHEKLSQLHQEMVGEGLSPEARVSELRDIDQAMVSQGVSMFRTTAATKH